MKLELHLQLKSDATFGRGDGIAGLVDEEVEHDAATGLPYIRGRTLKGLLVEECANLLFALSQHDVAMQHRFDGAAKKLFGQPGSTLEDDAIMRVGAALLPQALRRAVEADINTNPPRLQPADVLAALTAIRRQTAVDETTGAPEPHSLRAMRVVLRETPFVAQLDFASDPSEDALALLAACAMSLRRAGTGRNRGRGRLDAWLVDKPFTARHFARFAEALKKERP